jgi:uncharacterized protein (DUF488 family)
LADALHTIGYEGSDVERCVAALLAQRIQTVLDVRELPLSRKTGFSKTALAKRLRCSGIDYLHIRALGCPRSIRMRYRRDGDWTRYRKAFLKYLRSQKAALEAAVEKTRTSACALLCFEADPTTCHRSLVAAAIARHRHISVCHIE